MLLSLSIKNYALIESLDITFSNQFSIITGETGAGKSILLGALGLVLGNRADLSVLKDKDQKCVIEATFSLTNYNLERFFQENDLDYEDQTIIRREILPSGKSRAFINDSPVNLNELNELGFFLIDIHSQHETRELLNEAYQFDILDAVAQNDKRLTSYKKGLEVLNQSKKELKQLIAEKEALSKEQEYNNFLVEELVAAKLKEGEQKDLEEELDQLSNVELIKENLDKVLSVANEEQLGTLVTLNEIKQSLQKIAVFSKDYHDYHERIISVSIELQDIIDECFSSAEKIINDPERLEFVSTKLQTIYTLQKKHNVSTVEELLAIQNQLDGKLVRFEDLDAEIIKKEQEQVDIIEKLDQVANLLTKARLDAVPILSEQIQYILTQLGMPDAKIVFEIQPTDSYTKFGKDTISLLFSANKGMAIGPIKKMASGGEMSRIMLAVKAVLANYSKLPSIIFDEIDTGVSGEIAIKMGEIMKEMSKNMQVFAITHLPQIAAKGDQHYKVFKYNVENDTLSELKLLTAEQRVVEIAEMLSGKNISDSAINHAKELLN
ncbi:DNA repair protein RecN [Flavobacterium sp. NRK F7]|uniref:DNA repair protein RecN n=1 Tax=Flavobacterium sp. NRK F7 TaxID=2954930 RepID=UPI002090A112|nr:DNA repair protein RecN [Flavobacterium sp. NRK F7]MCO6163994.1 DNA repair protein RecN [Flavobacterium sp. NRK F7]